MVELVVVLVLAALDLTNQATGSQAGCQQNQWDHSFTFRNIVFLLSFMIGLFSISFIIHFFCDESTDGKSLDCHYGSKSIHQLFLCHFAVELDDIFKFKQATHI